MGANSATTTTFVAVALTAILLHATVLSRVEVDHLTLRIAALSSAIYGCLIFTCGFVSATLIAAAFWVPLWTHIICYRVFWHPLRSFPGPFGARVSKWWTVKKVWDTNWHYMKFQQQLQQEFGDYVRTGNSLLLLCLFSRISYPECSSLHDEDN